MTIVSAAFEQPPLLEREQELETLGAVIGAACHGRGGVRLIEGDAGLGKSRLLAVARSEAEDAGMRVVTAHCSELEQDFAFGVARQLLGDQALQRASHDLAAPPLGTILSLHDQLVELCRHDGERVPLLVAVDDAQWADEPSLRFLAHLALRVQELPVAVVATVRSGEPAASGELVERLRESLATAVVVPRLLSEDAVEEMARSALGETADGLTAACFRATGGNPFYVSELLRTLAGEPAIDPDQVARVAPVTVLRSIVVRLARLGSAAAELARAVAVLGDGASLRIAAKVASLDVLDAEAAADALARARIFECGEPLRFSHPLIVSALAADIGAFERARRHRRAADLLIAENAPAERVAAHLMIARPEGDARVAAVLEQAAERALSNGAPAVAARLLERALAEPPDPVDQPKMLLACAKADLVAGSPGAAERLELAVEGIEPDERRAEALGELATLAHLQWDLPRAVELAGRGQRLLDPAHPRRQHLLGIELAAAVLVAELSPRTVGQIEPLLAGARAGTLPSDPRLLAVVAGWAGVTDPPAVVRGLAEAAIGPDPLIDSSHGTSLGWVAAALEWADELDLSWRWLTDAIEAADRRGAVLAGSTALHNRGRVHLFAGRPTAAIADGEAALEIYRYGWTSSPWSTPGLVHAHLVLGDHDAAREAIEIGKRAGPQSPDHGRLLEAEARLMLAEADAEGALRTALAVGEMLGAPCDRHQPRVWEWRRLAALAAHGAGDGARALELIEPDLRVLHPIGPARQLGEALMIAGIATGGREGLELLRQSVTVLERSPSRLFLLEAQLALGGALRRDGSRTAAKEALRRALALAGEIGSPPLERRARDELSRLGLRPRRTALTGIASLTPSELQVAELAAEGLTTPQISAHLQVSRNTVDTHLRHTYQKLSLAGRHELPEALARESAVTP